MRAFASGKAVEYRERVAAFQVRKKIILRKPGQELFETLREIEKETLARTRRSFFGEAEVSLGRANSATLLSSYGLFVNRLAFSEDGRDDYLCAEHYVMLGNWDRDPDRYPRLQDVVWGFMRSLYGEDITPRRSTPGSALRKTPAHWSARGTPDESTAEGLAQQERLAKWVRLLEDEQVMECVIASYHAVPCSANTRRASIRSS